MSSELPKAGNSGKRKGWNKKGIVVKSNDAKTTTSVSLERNPFLGMNPVPILAGYGSRGERIRHTVHDGALKMPKEALDIIEDVTRSTGLSSPPTYELPGLDSVLRPSIDPKLETLIVTELGIEKVGIWERAPPQAMTLDGLPAAPAPPKFVHVLRPSVVNRTLRRLKSASSPTKAPTERIRGGGGDGESKMGIDPPVPPVAAAAAPLSTGVAVDIPVGSTSAMQVPQPAAPPQTAATPAVSGQSISAPTPTPFTTQNTSGFAPAKTMPTSAGTVATSGIATVSASLQTNAPPVNSGTIPVVQNVNVPKPVEAPVASMSTVPSANSTSAGSSTNQTGLAMQKAPVSGSGTASLSARPTGASVPVPSAAGSSSAIRPVPVPTLKVQSLVTKPEPTYELHRPGPNDEMVTPSDQFTPFPVWYQRDHIADIERKMLPEWFDKSAAHRTAETYKKARETILYISKTVANRNVTSAMVRRAIAGDAGSLMRLRNFLTHWGLINEDAINDSAPTAGVLRTNYPVQKQFSGRLKDELVNAVVEQASKRQKTGPDNEFVPIDWEEVAVQVGHGATSADCERNFLSIPLAAGATPNTERSITPDGSQEAQTPFLESGRDVSRQQFIRELIRSSSPSVIHKATEAALSATQDSSNLKEAQSGALLGLVAGRAVDEARKSEKTLESVLSQLLDQRMQKLENRMAMMDDVESILEAEKVALELERRDLYTARCRHWFGGT